MWFYLHESANSALLNRFTVKILIDAWVFIRIMVDAEVGNGRLIEATVLE